jgi:hypothetical protein
MSEENFGSFADGLMRMSQRNIYPRVNLTKKRAMKLEDIMQLAIDFSPDCRCGKKDDACHCRDDYDAAIGWVRYQISKRWSRFELVTERKN